MSPEIASAFLGFSAAVLLSLTALHEFVFRLYGSSYFRALASAWFLNGAYLVYELTLGRTVAESTQAGEVSHLLSYLIGVAASVFTYVAYRFAKRGNGWRRRTTWVRVGFWLAAVTVGVVASQWPPFAGTSHQDRILVLPGVLFSALVLWKLGRLFLSAEPTRLLYVLQRPDLGVLSRPRQSAAIRTLHGRIEEEPTPRVKRDLTRAGRWMGWALVSYAIIQFGYIFRAEIGGTPVETTLYFVGLASKVGYGIGVAYLLHADFLHVNDSLEERTEAATIGLVAASVQHDIRNPLSTIDSTLVALKQSLPQRHAQNRARIALLKRQVDRIRAAVAIIPGVREVHGFALKQNLRVNVVDLLNRARKSALAQSGSPDALVDRPDGPSVVHVLGNEHRLVDAFTNVLNNALEAYRGLDRRAHVSIKVKRTKAGVADIRIRDAGVGIPIDILHRVSEPMFSTKNERRPANRGMGLFMASRLIQQHKGELLVESDGRSFTEIRIQLPLADLVETESVGKEGK